MLVSANSPYKGIQVRVRSLKFHLASPALVFLLGLVSLMSSCGSPDRSVTIFEGEYTGDLAFVKDVTFSKQGKEFENELCVLVDPVVLWEPQNTAAVLGEHLTTTARMWVDGDRVAITSGNNLLLRTIATEGTMVGTVGSDMWFCFRVNDLETGTYLAEFQTQTVSGRLQGYRWTFEVEQVSSE